MRLPIKNRGVAAGLAVLAIAPGIFVASHLGGGTSKAVSAGPSRANSTTSAQPEKVAFSSKFAPVRDVAPVTESVAVNPPKAVPTPTPTPAPTPKSTPAASAPVSYAPGTIQAIICEAANSHGVSCQWMISIATCESGLNPRASNGTDIGLFQFLPSTFQAHGGTDIYDPAQQSNIAASMLANGQSNAWPVCSKR